MEHKLQNPRGTPHLRRNTRAPLHTSEIRFSRGGTEASVFFKSSPKWFSCAASVEKNLRVHTNPLGILFSQDSTSVGLGCGKSWDSAFLNKLLNYGLTNYAQEGGFGPPAKNGFCIFKALFKRKVKEYVTENVWVDAKINDFISDLSEIRSVKKWNTKWSRSLEVSEYNTHEDRPFSFAASVLPITSDLGKQSHVLKLGSSQEYLTYH